jgi:hypothetical protein
MTAVLNVKDKGSFSEGSKLYVDGDRLCSSQRLQQSQRDEQDYLARHNPVFSSFEAGVLAVLAVLLFGLIGSHILAPNSSPRPDKITETSRDMSASEQWQDSWDDIDLRR